MKLSTRKEVMHKLLLNVLEMIQYSETVIVVHVTE